MEGEGMAPDVQEQAAAAAAQGDPTLRQHLSWRAREQHVPPQAQSLQQQQQQQKRQQQHELGAQPQREQRGAAPPDTSRRQHSALGGEPSTQRAPWPPTSAPAPTAALPAPPPRAAATGTAPAPASAAAATSAAPVPASAAAASCAAAPASNVQVPAPEQQEPRQQLLPLLQQQEQQQQFEEHQWRQRQQQTMDQQQQQQSMEQQQQQQQSMEQQQQQQQQQQQEAALAAAEAEAATAAAAAAAAAAAQAAPRAHAALAELQRRVFEQLGWSAQDVRLMQHCVRRAQQASPACAARTVLGVLPSVRLQLPDDPPGMLHSVSCLLEVVATPLPDAGAAGGGAAQGVSLRLTVFASAGAVACWHEAPPDPTAPLAFSPLTRAPYWGTEPGGFSLYFPHPFCPQIDLFTGIHQYAAALGTSALLWPTAGLTGWDSGAAAPVVSAAEGALLEQQAQHELAGQRSAGTLPPLSPAPPRVAPSLHPAGQGESSGGAAASPAAATPSRRVQQRGLASPPHVGGSMGAGGSSLGTLQLSLPHAALAPLPAALPNAAPAPLPAALPSMPALPGLSCFLDPRARCPTG